MSDSPEIQTKSECGCRGEALAYSFAYLLLRVWLAMRAIFTGLEKYAGKKTIQTPLLDEFGNPDINGTMVAVDKKFYGFSEYQGLPPSMKAKFAAEPFLPDFLLTPYATVLGPLLILLGLMLLLGVFSRWTLFIMGLVYVSLTFGLVLINESSGVAWLAIHLIMIVMALCLAKHDRFCATHRW
jgi:thiosulfate dehydrogenase (quinone) large subunit